MALIKCPNCGRDASDQAKTCLYCKTPINGLDTYTRTQTNSQNDDENNNTTSKFVMFVKFVVAIVAIGFIVSGVWGLIPPAYRPNSNESDARKDAELRVQNSVYSEVGIIPKTESTVVYKNNNYICVGVNYTFESSFNTNVYWSRVILWHRHSKGIPVGGSSADWGGVDIHNLTTSQINQIKVFFELD